jgi:DNA mismatch endonuclease (patch repair protein)
VTDKLTRERRSANMRKIRSKNTLPEKTVRHLVYAMGYRYRLHVAKLPGKPDIVLSRLKKIIEVRGCFWHQHQGCIDLHIPKSNKSYWGPKLRRNVQRDIQVETGLRSLGWRVLVLWACELSNEKLLKKRLKAFLN